MADIKNLSIFSNQSKGLNKIKEETQRKKEEKEPKQQTVLATERKEKPVVKSDQKLKSSIHSKRTSRSVGAPIKNYDQVFTSKSPLKLSAIVVSLTRILSEKYMAESTRDEILRLALNNYVKHHFTKEDKQDLLNDIERELVIFRKQNPTFSQYDEQGILEKTPEEIEAETLKYLIDEWGLKSYD